MVCVMVVILTMGLTLLHCILEQILTSCCGLQKHHSKAFVQPATMSACTGHNDADVSEATNCMLGIAA